MDAKPWAILPGAFFFRVMKTFKIIVQYLQMFRQNVENTLYRLQKTVFYGKMIAGIPGWSLFVNGNDRPKIFRKEVPP